jgi:thiopeptide-type bacteriocin biosynthesis protein
MIERAVNDCLREQEASRMGRGESASTDSVTDVRWVSYVPEVERYGGLAALPVAEEVFCASTNVAVALLRQYDGTARTRRVSDAAQLMLVTLRTFWPNAADARWAAESYGMGYTERLCELGARPAVLERLDRHVAEGHHTISGIRRVWEQLSDGVAPQNPQEKYSRVLRLARREFQRLAPTCAASPAMEELPEWQKRVNWVVPSYLHMMNNRLGVTMVEEAYLGRIIARALSM